VVFHSRSGGTRRLVEAAIEGARLGLEADADLMAPSPREDFESVCARDAFDATPEDVIAASGLLIATPANFGYMSGALKDFFERVYHRCLDVTTGLPYALMVKGDTDVDGAASSVRRIAAGMKWREVLPALLVVGDIVPGHLEEAHELGATLGAGLGAGIY
jgi:multimeric flavodoxin WrbA